MRRLWTPLCLALAAALAAPARAELWIGPHAGLHLGLGGGRDSVAEINGPRSYQADTRGMVGGAQLGWDWRFGRVVAGVEVEIGHLGQSGDTERADAAGAVRSRAELGPHAAASLRLGWLAAPHWLVFGRIGADAARFEASTTQSCAPASCAPATARGTTYGLVLGAGVEHALEDGWRLRLDYAWHGYRDELVLPPAVPGGPGWRHDMDLHMIRLALNRQF